MKTAAIPLSVALGISSGIACAQTPGDPMAALRACSQMEGTARLDCLDRLSRDIAPPAPRPATPPQAGPAASQATTPGQVPPADNWIVSETTSPVDYTPIAVATAQAAGADGATVQLSISCRGGRTELIASGPTAPRPEDYTVAYSVNCGPPSPVATAAPVSGQRAAFRVDVARLLRSLPDAGEISVRISTRQGAVREGAFALDALKTVRERMAATCRWPAAGTPARN